MKKRNVLPMIIVLALLIAIPVITGYFQRSGFELRISALEEDEPRNVQISDIKETSFKVTWITEREVIGGVSLKSGGKTFEEDSKSYHEVIISGLQRANSYKFVLLSGSTEYQKSEGIDYIVKTASAQIGDDQYLIYGQVFSPDGFSFQQGGILTLEMKKSSGKSQLVSTVINETGGYKIDLGGLLDQNLAQSFDYRQISEAVFQIYISHNQEGVEKRYTVNFSENRQIPNIYLGEVNIDIIPAIDGT